MLESEMAAAVAGGVTSLVCPPDTDPVLDEPGLVEMLRHRAEKLHQSRVLPLGALTRGLKGEVLTEMGQLTAAGCVGFSQAEVPIPSTQVLQRALQYASTFGFTVWGAKVAALFGADFSAAEFWQWPGPKRALADSILSDTSSLTNFGMILGAMTAAAATGPFARASWPPLKSLAAAAFAVALVVPALAQNPPQQTAVLPQITPPAGARQGGGRGAQTPEQIKAARDREVEGQKQTDAAWRKASEGVMKMEKITYKSTAKDGMAIPAFVFTPLKPRGDKGHPALVWVHPDIRGHVYEYYIPYVQDAVKRGYVVIAPEYRGSYGYGAEHYDAIDYGGEEVTDVTSATAYLKTLSIVDPERIGIIGWSHGGMITLLSIEREPKMFKAAAALVPVTNLFQRLAWNGVEQRKASIDPQNRYGGLPHEKRDEYKRRSPIYQIDAVEIPLLVHITRNDADVVFEEAAQLVDALRVVVLVPEERQHDHRLAEVHRLRRRVVPAVGDHEIDLGDDRRLGQELGAPHVRRQLVLGVLVIERHDFGQASHSVTSTLRQVGI